MASTFSGLFRTLAWTDFPKRPGSAPAAGQFVDLAQTKTSTGFGGLAFPAVAGTKPAQHRLADTFTVSAKFVPTQSFVLTWLLGQSQTLQDDMLNHEQGHYNLAALVARDFFVDVMLTKTTLYASAREGAAAVTQLQQASVGKSQAVQDLYDQEVHPEQRLGVSRGPVQQAWDRFIQKAFTDARSTGTTAADGTPHKVRLIDLLTQSGRSV